jgi:hypothetical protein
MCRAHPKSTHPPRFINFPTCFCVCIFKAIGPHFWLLFEASQAAFAKARPNLLAALASGFWCSAACGTWICRLCDETEKAMSCISSPPVLTFGAFNRFADNFNRQNGCGDRVYGPAAPCWCQARGSTGPTTRNTTKGWVCEAELFLAHNK